MYRSLKYPQKVIYFMLEKKKVESRSRKNLYSGFLSEDYLGLFVLKKQYTTTGSQVMF